VSDDYSKAMTLRDCVLFVKGSLDAFEDTADIRLADLDFKHPHPEKVAKWMSTERVLIDQGWYTNTEIDGVIDSTCLLTRRSL
jgi:inositol-pentakisphosphate 2-kinase